MLIAKTEFTELAITKNDFTRSMLRIKEKTEGGDCRRVTRPIRTVDFPHTGVIQIKSASSSSRDSHSILMHFLEKFSENMCSSC